MSEGTPLQQIEATPARARDKPPVDVRPVADRRALLFAWGGGALALLVSAALFSRYNIQGALSRDESIYAYAGQQMADGVPMYVSIFDPKPPLGTILAGFGALGGRAFGVNELLAMRVEFFVFACLTVVAVYLLGLWLWESVVAGLAGAAVFASFKGFAVDALAGPDAKTPGIFFAVLSMALLVRRRWFLGALSGSLAFLVWQPLVIYAVVAVVGALLASDAGARWKQGARALAGAAIPVAATVLYFWIAGGLSQMVEAVITFPLTGLERGNVTVAGNAEQIVDVVNQHYGHTRVLFWGGLILLGVVLVEPLVRSRPGLRRAIREPFFGVATVTFLALAAFSLSDFQGYPDLYPLLPYAAIGIAGAVALAERRIGAGVRGRRAATTVALVAVAVLVGLSWSWYSDEPAPARDLRAMRRDAKKIDRVLAPGETLYALGDPRPLVLTERRNPSRFIFLGSGVSAWVVHHTPGGIEGWKAQIRAADPAVIIMNAWRGHARNEIQTWARSTYGPGTLLGNWLLFAKPAIRARAARMGIRL